MGLKSWFREWLLEPDEEEAVGCSIQEPADWWELFHRETKMCAKCDGLDLCDTHYYLSKLLVHHIKTNES